MASVGPDSRSGPEPAPALHPASFPHLPFSLTTRCCFSWAPTCNAPGSVSELSWAPELHPAAPVVPGSPYLSLREPGFFPSTAPAAPDQAAALGRRAESLDLWSSLRVSELGPGIASLQASPLHIGMRVGSWQVSGPLISVHLSLPLFPRLFLFLFLFFLSRHNYLATTVRSAGRKGRLNFRKSVRI